MFKDTNILSLAKIFESKYNPALKKQGNVFVSPYLLYLTKIFVGKRLQLLAGF
jgi:hypothetical protein